MLLDDILKVFEENKNNIAYRNEKYEVSYSTLYKYVCNLYNYLNAINLEKKIAKIIVYGNKDVTMITSFLACSFAGITYIPVDSSISKERLNNIIKLSNADLIISTIDEEICNVNNIDVISFSVLKNIIKKTENIQLIPLMKEDDVYYIIFTSGTTGVPKGVEVTYKNLNSFIYWFVDIIKHKYDNVLNQAPFSFDLSVADIYYSLSVGSTLVTYGSSIYEGLYKYFIYLKNSHINMIVCTPTFIELLLCDKYFNNENFSDLKILFFCGEVLRNDIVKKIYERFRNIRIINSYGPTECTVAVTSIELNKNIITKDIPIGKEKTNTNIHIVDKENNILKDGQVGEILIVGDSVAKDYINFNSNNFIDFCGRHGYLTGDIGYKLDNEIYYVSRKDEQIKYKGYRIELKDIEKNLYNLKYINKAIVKANKDKYGKVVNINAYIVLNDKNIIKKDIEKRLLDVLPKYMIPKIFILDEIPINKNGKSFIL